MKDKQKILQGEVERKHQVVDKDDIHSTIIK